MKDWEEGFVHIVIYDMQLPWRAVISERMYYTRGRQRWLEEEYFGGEGEPLEGELGVRKKYTHFCESLHSLTTNIAI